MTDIIGRAKVVVSSEVDSTSVTSVGSKMGDLLGGALKKGVIGAAAGVGALIGTTIFKGFQRLDAIETAQAKLKGFGNSAKAITQIMKDANASVKGTAFGLGEAATVAAQAVAAGIKPGKELEGILKTVANNAAGAGTSLEEMGSIFAKAMTQANGVQNDVIQQLADKGIPIYQALADQLGVTAGEVFDLASAGEISFDEFSAAAEKAGGTVADELGDTFQGSLKNAGAALGRLGAALIGESFTTAPDLFKAITKKLDELEPAAKKVGEQIREIIDGIKDWANSKSFKQIQSSMKTWGEDLLTVGGALKTIVKAMDALKPGGQGKGLLDFLVKLEDHTTPLKVLADIIRTIRNAADDGEKLTDFLSIGPIRVNPPNPAKAAGGPGSGLTLVGERGPELVDLPNGSYVHNTPATQAIIDEVRSASNGGNTTVFNITGPVSLAELRQRAAWYDTYGTRFGGTG